MRNRHFKHNKDKSPLLLLLAFLMLIAAIFTFFKENKKETPEVEKEPDVNPKDFI